MSRRPRKTTLTERRFWTPEEEAFLIENYGKIPSRKMAEMLGRGPSAVRGKAMKMRQRDPYYVPEKDRLVEVQNFELPPITNMPHIGNRELRELVAEAMESYALQAVKAFRNEIVVNMGFQGNIRSVVRQNKEGEVLEVIRESASQRRRKPTPARDPFALLTTLGARR